MSGLIETLVARVEDLERQVRELRAATAVQTDTLLGSAAVAALLGKSRRALEEDFRRARLRGEVHPLVQLAITIDGARRWKRSDVLLYVDAKQRDRSGT